MKKNPDIKTIFSKKDIEALDYYIDSQLVKFLSIDESKYKKWIDEFNKKKVLKIKDLENRLKVFDTFVFIDNLMGILDEDTPEEFKQLKIERENITNGEDLQSIFFIINSNIYKHLNAKDYAYISIYLAEKMKKDPIYKETTIKKTTLLGLVTFYLNNNPLIIDNEGMSEEK